MDVEAAIGAVAAPTIISGVLGVVNWAALDRIQVVGDFKRLAAIVLGIIYGVVAWQAGVIEVDNGLVASLLGLTFGLGAMGWHGEVVTRLSGRS